MKVKRIYLSGLFLGVSLLSATGVRAGTEQAARGNSAGTCVECHKAEAQTLLGEWQHVAMKSATIQLKVGDRTEIVTFAKAQLKLNNAAGKGDTEKMLRSIGEGAEVSVRYVEKDGAKEATVITVKPVVKLAVAQKLALADLEKLVARGPEKGKYILVDSRPVQSFAQGAIPTAISLPFSEFAGKAGALPADKKRLIVFYGDNARSRMGTDSMKRARALGYRNVKVLGEGMEGWLASRRGSAAKSAVARIPKPGEFAMEEFIKIIGAIPADTLIMDVRNGEELKDGAIRGAVNIPTQELFRRAAEIPRDKKVIAYCNTGARAEMAYHILKAKGYDNIYFLKAHVDFDNGKPDIY